MQEEEKKPSEEGVETGKKEGKLSFRNIFYHNTFVLIFSFVTAIVIWFVMAAGNTDRPRVMHDVPIEIKLSDAALNDGLKVFNSSYTTADIGISGNSFVTNKLSGSDLSVTATLNPTSTKLTGNTLQKITVPVKAVKQSSFAEYEIDSVDPQEVVLEYDRYKETSFPIENKLTYSADAGYYSSTPTLSEAEVVVSGPESSVNKISRAAINTSVSEALRSDKSLSCEVTLYDQNDQPVTDYTGLYLERSVETVEVTIPILSKKTVKILPYLINQPKGFADQRITVEPEEIEIAAPADVLSGIDDITLDTAIDFSELDISESNEFTMEIPIPSGVKDISNQGTEDVSTATVSINLKGYQQAKITTTNLSPSGVPAGKTADIINKSLDITVIGSEAQIAKLTGESVSCKADLTNFAENNGSITVPVTVSISGTNANSCWAVGKYTVSVTLSEQATEAAALKRSVSRESGVAATPQE